jgi:hypothetical protein
MSRLHAFRKDGLETEAEAGAQRCFGPDGKPHADPGRGLTMSAPGTLSLLEAAAVSSDALVLDMAGGRVGVGVGAALA